MSQRAVSFVIHTLLTDQDLRDRFARSPIEVLEHLHLSAGIELTKDEVEALVPVRPEVWRSTIALTPTRIH